MGYDVTQVHSHNRYSNIRCCRVCVMMNFFLSDIVFYDFAHTILRCCVLFSLHRKNVPRKERIERKRERERKKIETQGERDPEKVRVSDSDRERCCRFLRNNDLCSTGQRREAKNHAVTEMRSSRALI